MTTRDSNSTNPTAHVTDTALIFEGGGMRASYTSAVVSLLLDQGISFDWVGGISAGASNTANYLSRDKQRSYRSFVEFAADPNFGNMRTWMAGKGLFNAPYIYEEAGLANAALPYDWDTYQSNPTQFAVGAFEMETGKMQYWGREDVAELHDLMVRVRASSSLPVVMPPVTLGGKTYVDGALGPTGGFALDAARAAGYRKFFVVMTRGRDYVKPPQSMNQLYRRIFRKYPAVVNGIMHRHHRYNQTRAELFELERRGEAYLFLPENMGVSNSERDVRKLRESYELGALQARYELPAWKEFLEL
ncbi:patatin-like phospholipase family protein [Gulosibacter chungangensis]|uniref:patatin-like phospholipase family protein n=1 Tax=Gulosibacter chungangensis TaxID=979746 RepID=UPI001CE4B491|nr:patatin family protein [Gulosibacter chungangensis]